MFGTHLTLVQSMHPIYEDLVHLYSDMLILFHALSSADYRTTSLNRLVPDAGLVALNVLSGFILTV